MLKNRVAFLFLFILALPSIGISQEITIFKVSDFDLKGEVKSCLVSTDYGKEEYQFDESGRLTEAVTRFSEDDYDITIYTYGNNQLLEKRVESFRDQQLDRAISIANFYTYDSTYNRKVIEKIITYEKKFLEQYEYSYTSGNRLSKVIRTNNEGIDETSVVYHKDQEGTNADYVLNRELQRSVHTKIEAISDSTQTKTITTKKFLDGRPNTTIKEIFNSNGQLESITQSSYDADLEKFILEKSTVNTYDENGTTARTETRSNGDVVIKEFIYQYDPNENWIKQIVTPENSYKTRKIMYYESEEAAKVED